MRRLRALDGWRATLMVWGPMLAIALLHYETAPTHHWVHDVARRLYYLPIFFAAYLGGLPGGVLGAVVAGLLYLPHAWMHFAGVDPASSTEKALELAFYLVLGTVSGVLIDREHRERARVEHFAARLRDTQQQLVRAGRLEALGTLTAGVAHEVRNPLHAMRGTAEILLDALPRDAPELKLARAHLAEIDRLSTVLQRFLDFARPTPPHVSEVRLDMVAARVADLLRAEAARHGVELAVGGGPATARADENQLVQVVLGIAINGLQAMGLGGRIALSTLSAERHGRREAAIVVENDGPPIPSADLERIFDPFFTTRKQGTGLGLAVAERITEAHGGAIEVENLPGGAGVRFSVWLPSAPR